MGKAQQTPIYTSRELAEMLYKHDRENPDPGGECSCGNGLIAAARAQLPKTAPVMVPGPRPYIPPDLARGTRGTGGHDS